MSHWALALGEVEELALCSCCKRAFDDAERSPKLLACRHHFCLACARTVLAKGRELYCVHCWKRTELPDGRVEALPTHAPVLALARRLHAPPPPPPLDADTCAAHALPALWCTPCGARACRACGEHAAHPLSPPGEARALLLREGAELRGELARLRAGRREAVLRALDAATALKTRLEVELAAPDLPDWPSPSRGLPALAAERERLRARLAEAALQSRLDDLVRSSPTPLDPELVSRALAAPAAGPVAPPAVDERRDSTLLLANHCLALIYSRQGGTPRPRPAILNGGGEAALLRVSPPLVSPGAALPRSPAAPHPLFYLNVEVDGRALGRVVVEVRADAAPRMARNFSVLCSGELGVGYRGCSVFQCWEGESVITGDFELNNGRGGRSVYEESYFMPDETGLAATRGAVGMRRSQRRHDNLGLVGSQFRIVLREMRGFTAIFGFVVEGLELVDRLSRTGDSAGKPRASILIASCGRLS